MYIYNIHSVSGHKLSMSHRVLKLHINKIYPDIYIYIYTYMQMYMLCHTFFVFK